MVPSIFSATNLHPLSRFVSRCIELPQITPGLLDVSIELALAIYTLRCFVGATAAIFAIKPELACSAASSLGSLRLVARSCLGSTSSPLRARIVHLVTGLLFAVPAARAGYDVTLALVQIGIPSEIVASRIRYG
jgi:hypothetical protein